MMEEEQLTSWLAGAAADWREGFVCSAAEEGAMMLMTIGNEAEEEEEEKVQ